MFQEWVVIGGCHSKVHCTGLVLFGSASALGEPVLTRGISGKPVWFGIGGVGPWKDTRFARSVRGFLEAGQTAGMLLGMPPLFGHVIVLLVMCKQDLLSGPLLGNDHLPDAYIGPGMCGQQGNADCACCAITGLL